MDDVSNIALPDSEDLFLSFFVAHEKATELGLARGVTAIIKRKGQVITCTIVDLKDDYPRVPKGQLEIIARHEISYEP